MPSAADADDEGEDEEERCRRRRREVMLRSSAEGDDICMYPQIIHINHITMQGKARI